MHPYATDSNERVRIISLLAILSVFLVWGLESIFGELATVNPLVRIPSPFVVFGFLYFGFKKEAWKWKPSRWFDLVSVPDLNGRWKGVLKTSFDDFQTEHEVDFEIEQSWTHIAVRKIGGTSRSYSLTASILTQSSRGITLSYEYRNRPSAEHGTAMREHRGVTILHMDEPNKLEGEYFTGGMRETHGKIQLEREH